jgi:NAD(P)-dependent dehydrogenase (short-subunit alcohol dehydrogenase family)
MKISALFDVRGLVTVVTGGASGIGFACAKAMAENGAKVTLFDSNRDMLQEAVRKLGGETRGEVVDVTDRAEVDKMMGAVAHSVGRLDVVFANAGIGGGPGFLKTDGTRNTERQIEQLPSEQWERVLQVNVIGAFNTLQAAARIMKPQNAGRIIVTSSIDAFKIEQHVGTPYVVSKGAVGQLVKQAALELARYNVTVNAIAPGPWITNISGGRLRDPAAREPFEKMIPMHRLGQEEDMYGIALFLASPAARYVTGAQIVVDGGFSLGTAD